MTENGKHYCDECWAQVLDNGYTDNTQLCDMCWWDNVGRHEVLGAEAMNEELLSRVVQ